MNFSNFSDSAPTVSVLIGSDVAL